MQVLIGMAEEELSEVGSLDLLGPVIRCDPRNRVQCTVCLRASLHFPERCTEELVWEVWALPPECKVEVRGEGPGAQRGGRAGLGRAPAE